MINYKISFLIVLIYVVCSSDAAKTSIEVKEDYENCLEDMRTTFVGIKRSTHNCIRIAIREMKLYGPNAFSYNKHLELYYRLFYKSVPIDSVILPEKFCKKKGVFPPQVDEKCLKELQIFLEPPTFPVITDDEEQEGEGTSQSNPIILDSSTSQNNPGSSQNVSDSQEYLDKWLDSEGWPVTDDQQVIENYLYGSTSDVNILKNALYGPDKDTLRRNVLKNALYKHVIYEPNKGYLLPGDKNSRKYFHLASSNGYLYLGELSRTIEFKRDSLTYPTDFCEQQKSKDLNEIEEERKMQSGLH